jgi:hypothetical protein
MTAFIGIACIFLFPNNVRPISLLKSQRETADDRAARREDAIRRLLGWQEDILSLEGGKSKGMHWRTFERLQIEQDNFAGQCLACIIARFRFKIVG